MAWVSISIGMLHAPPFGLSPCFLSPGRGCRGLTPYTARACGLSRSLSLSLCLSAGRRRRGATLRPSARPTARRIEWLALGAPMTAVLNDVVCSVFLWCKPPPSYLASSPRPYGNRWRRACSPLSPPCLCLSLPPKGTVKSMSPPVMLRAQGSEKRE